VGSLRREGWLQPVLQKTRIPVQAERAVLNFFLAHVDDRLKERKISAVARCKVAMHYAQTRRPCPGWGGGSCPVVLEPNITLAAAEFSRKLLQERNRFGRRLWAWRFDAAVGLRLRPRVSAWRRQTIFFGGKFCHIKRSQHVREYGLGKGALSPEPARDWRGFRGRIGVRRNKRSSPPARPQRFASREVAGRLTNLKPSARGIP